MAEIDPDLLKWYKPLTAAEGDSLGGDIDTGALITSDVKHNLFDAVTDGERVAGDIDYRKTFLRNENSDTIPAPLFWIEEDASLATTEVSICLAGTKSMQGTPANLTGTGTFAASTTIATTSDLRGEIAPGEAVYNATDDDEGDAVRVTEVTENSITLATAYAGTTGSGKTIAVAGADQFPEASWVEPDSDEHADVLEGIALAQNGYQGIWIRRKITAAGNGAVGDGPTIRFSTS